MGSLKTLMRYFDIALHIMLCVAFGWFLAELWRVAHPPAPKPLAVMKLEDGFMLFEAPTPTASSKRGQGFI